MPAPTVSADLALLLSLLAHPPPTPSNSTPPVTTPPGAPSHEHRNSPTKNILEHASTVLNRLALNDDSDSDSAPPPHIQTTTPAHVASLIPHLSISKDPLFLTRMPNIIAWLTVTMPDCDDEGLTDLNLLIRKLYDEVYCVANAVFKHSRQNSWHDFERLTSDSRQASFTNVNLSTGNNEGMVDSDPLTLD